MDLGLSADQEAIRDAFAALFARASRIEVVRAAEPLGFDPALWSTVVAAGVPSMALETGLLELALVAREAGRRLAPVPVVESFAATRLLGAAPDGEAVATIALQPAAGATGIAALVPAGAVASTVVALDGDELVAVRSAPPGVAPANLGCAPLADRDVRDGERRVLAHGDDATRRHATAVDEWRALTAAALVGLARSALDLAVDYVQGRRQFGVPIGSFQSVQHGLADVATALEGAELLALEAAWALDERLDDASRIAAAAFVAASRAARDVTAAALHFHGGYGFMLEYDVQLHFRRAGGWPLSAGDPAALQVELGANVPLAASQSRRVRLGDASGAHERAEAVRREMAAFLDAHLTDDVIERVHGDGTVHDWGLHRAMARAGWFGAAWPVEEGGRGLDPYEVGAMREELARRSAPMDGWGTSELVAHTLRIVGNEQQRAEVIPRILAGDVLVCLGYSEPDAGSDVASITTRAVRDGDEWVIDGQKMFTTLAHESAYVFLLTRTDTSVPKHRGLTMFLVPMDAPGIEVRPIHTLGGERTNVTFYSGVRVADSCRVGEVDGGWDVMTVALAFERQPTAHGEAVRLLTRSAAAARAAGRHDDPVVQHRLGRLAVENEVGRVLAHRMYWLAAEGRLPVVEGSMAKLFSSESLRRASGDLLDVFGAAAVLRHGEAGAPADGWLEHAHRHAQVHTIYAGTSEIQRSIIAERGLGLPRSRPAG